jgi:TolB-like protein
MNRLKYLILGILALIMAGCGQTVVESLKVPEGAGPNAPGTGKSVVILPFADYSFADSMTAAYRRNLQVTEALTDNLVANGFGTSVQEDVFRYMIDKNLISLVAYEETHAESLRNELSGEWSNEMKSILRTYISEQQMAGDNKSVSAPGTHGLDESTIRQIGRRFNADYIVRGRILEYKTRQDPSWEPWKKGFLPFILQGTSRIALGFADSDKYDRYGQMTAGATYGALIGYQTVWPFDNDGSSYFGASAATTNAIVWGAAGAALGDMAYNSGKVDQAVVQMRIWVQEAATGNLVWTNRVRVQVSPETFFADSQYDALFNSAIEKSVSSLIDDFVTYGL